MHRAEATEVWVDNAGYCTGAGKRTFLEALD
jgi:hypothetical protein